MENIIIKKLSIIDSVVVADVTLFVLSGILDRMTTLGLQIKIKR
jgi:hypothetical protein